MMRTYERPKTVFLSISPTDCIQTSSAVAFGGQGNDADYTVNGSDLKL